MPLIRIEAVSADVFGGPPAQDSVAGLSEGFVASDSASGVSSFVGFGAFGLSIRATPMTATMMIITAR